MAMQTGTIGSSEKTPPKSNLSSSAQEVAKQLKVIYEKLQELKEEIGGSLIELANKIIKGEAEESDKINFRLSLTEEKSEAIASLTGEDNEKAKIIINNFIDKLRKSVDEDKVQV